MNQFAEWIYPTATSLLVSGWVVEAVESESDAEVFCVDVRVDLEDEAELLAEEPVTEDFLVAVEAAVVVEVVVVVVFVVFTVGTGLLSVVETPLK